MTQALGLTGDMRTRWDRDGVFVVEGAIPTDCVARLQAEIWAFLEMSPDDVNSWYDEAIRARVGIDDRGMIPLYHSPGMWGIRENRNLHAIFAELLGTPDLAVSFDRLNMNPPATEDWGYDGFIHWDIDVTEKPVPFQIQGLVALTDSPAGTGGFQCARGFHHRLDDWLAGPGYGFSGRFPDTAGMTVEPVPLRAGDVLIWRGELPHGNTRNTGDRPRLAQYVTFVPGQSLSDADIEARRNSFLHGAPPCSSTMGKAFPKAAKQAAGGIALSDHGKRLLGFSL